MISGHFDSISLHAKHMLHLAPLITPPPERAAIIFPEPGSGASRDRRGRSRKYPSMQPETAPHASPAGPLTASGGGSWMRNSVSYSTNQS